MSELDDRYKFRSAILQRWPGAHWQRFEDKLGVGIPDCNVQIPNLGAFWLEFKHMNVLPVRDTTPIKLGLQQEQALWLRARQRAGGVVRVVARVETVWMVFGQGFMELAEGVSLERLLELCYWRGGTLNLDAIFESPEAAQSGLFQEAESEAAVRR